MPLTSDAKKLLAETIRGTQQAPEKGLRARLLRAVHDEADRRYRLSVSIGAAGLDEAHRKRRERIEAWIAERVRAAKPKTKLEQMAAQDRLLAQAEKEAAATLLNRLVLLRHLEALGLSKPAVLTGGWNSKGYREFRNFAPALCKNGTNDATEGYATLLQLLFDELAVDLPGLFGDVGLTRLFAIPAAMLREVVERLDDRGLASAWTDDTTLGWVYQYWNDPDREALDAKINAGGKIEPYEIASKTQMFTERYIVEWLLQNSLGLTWLCMCKKQGWTPDAERVLPVLEARRVEWRARREAGEVALDALMPMKGELEDHWKYYVPQPIPEEAVEKAPASVRDLKILDPACGSGHFLVIAFGLLTALYREEARHRGETIADREIAESILENNLFGIDIDPRAIQIAAAGLYLKAKSLAKEARPKQVNLVAPALQIGNLSPHDPAVANLRQDLKREVGIPEELTNQLLASLAGVDYLGSLLKVDSAVEDALGSVEQDFEGEQRQSDIFNGLPDQRVKLSLDQAKATILDKLELFLAKHSRSEDLGIRLDGVQLAEGVRFVRIAREGVYDVVIGNPPYQGLSKTDSLGYITMRYPRGKADLFAAFLERGITLARPGGLSGMVTMRSWMFLGQFADLRRHVLHAYDLRIVGDLDKGAFETMTTSQLISVAMAVFHVSSRSVSRSVALQPTAPAEKYWGPDRTDLKRAAIMVQRGRYEFDPQGFAVIEGEPIVYWWSKEFLEQYAGAPKLGRIAPARFGINTGNNARFLRLWYEVAGVDLLAVRHGESSCDNRGNWVAFVGGAKGRVWVEDLRDVVRWAASGLELRIFETLSVGCALRNLDFQFCAGIAFAMIGAAFSARAHRFRSVFDSKGSSVFPSDIPGTLCLLNTSISRFILQSLNPSISFQVGDVNRLAVFPVVGADDIWRVIEVAFSLHEAGREASFEFKAPTDSPWRYAQAWAQLAVDRASGEALPPYEAKFDSPDLASFVSFAIGVALGRFGANGEAFLGKASESTLVAGTLFVSAGGFDSLEYGACTPIHTAWKEHGSAVLEGADLRTYLRKSFFDYHKKVYENRPIYFPLSSARKSFVAFASIHRWQDDTLNVLLADHLVPAMRRLEGELDDLRVARTSGGSKARAEKRFIEVQRLLEELNDFIAKVTEIAEKGPPPPDDKTPRREVDARYVMDLDDGVMVNSAALWPLLEPQWKDPKKWWKELATAQGKKDYDWSHLAARYFPTRARQKCHDDPSLAVAHGCFWELHPAKAYAWELRLQDEIRPDFTIDEPGSDAARAQFLAEHEDEAAAILAHETRRRELKAAKAEEGSETGTLFRDAEEPEELPDD